MFAAPSKTPRIFPSSEASLKVPSRRVSSWRFRDRRVHHDSGKMVLKTFHPKNSGCVQVESEWEIFHVFCLLDLSFFSSIFKVNQPMIGWYFFLSVQHMKVCRFSNGDWKGTVFHNRTEDCTWGLLNHGGSGYEVVDSNRGGYVIFIYKTRITHSLVNSINILPPFHTPKMIIFSRKPMIVGETHHFRVHPHIFIHIIFLCI